MIIQNTKQFYWRYLEEIQKVRISLWPFLALCSSHTRWRVLWGSTTPNCLDLLLTRPRRFLWGIWGCNPVERSWNSKCTPKWAQWPMACTSVGRWVPRFGVLNLRVQVLVTWDINWNPFGGTGTRTGLWNSHFVRTKIRIGTLIKIYIEHRFRFFRSVEAEHFSKVDK